VGVCVCVILCGGCSWCVSGSVVNAGASAQTRWGSYHKTEDKEGKGKERLGIRMEGKGFREGSKNTGTGRV